MARILLFCAIICAAAAVASAQQFLQNEDAYVRDRRSPVLGLFGGGVHKGGGHFVQHGHNYKETYGVGPFYASFQHSTVKGHGGHYGAGFHKGPAHYHGYHGGHHGGGGYGGLFSLW